MYEDLTGKKILLTGGTSGIGEEVLARLNSQQTYVHLVGRSKSKLTDAMRQNNCVTSFTVCDLSDLHSIEKDLASVSISFDGVVLSAGIANFLPIKFLKSEKTQEIFNINFFSNVLIIQHLVRNKLLKPSASIVCVSSIAQYVAENGTSIYSASKAALTAFARNAALELSPQKIRVNTISPGLVRTKLLNDENGLLTTGALEKNQALYPLGLGSATDIASCALFLLSSSSSWITGTDIKMDGGFCLK